MSRPAVSETADELYAALGAFTIGDEGRDWHLLRFCDALCRVMLEKVHELVADHDGRPGWQVVFDPDACPDYALPYLAQFVGTTLEDQWTEAERRTAIKVPEGWRRGTRNAIYAAVQRTLTGTKNVNIVERVGDDAYALEIRVLASEQAGSPTETERAARRQKPIGLFLDYETDGAETWDDVESNFATWDDLEAELPTWFDVVHAAP